MVVHVVKVTFLVLILFEAFDLLSLFDLKMRLFIGGEISAINLSHI